MLGDSAPDLHYLCNMKSYLQIENLSKSFGDRLLFGDVTLGIFEGDKVSAEFNTTSREVREALSESADELSQAFQEKGIKVGKINVKLVDNVG